MLAVDAVAGCWPYVSRKDSVELGSVCSVSDAAAKRCAASWTLEGKVPALALLKPEGKFVGGNEEASEGALAEEGRSFDGDPVEAIERKAGGLYRASACSSRALKID